MIRLSVALIAIVLCLGLLCPAVVSANGVDLSYPAAKVYAITQVFSPSHQAIDYGFSSGTKVAAARYGSVADSRFDVADGTHTCDGTINNRGNYIVLDHDNSQTRYYHLSKNGNTPATGQTFFRGEYMALSDDTGCSTGPHLHFEVRVNGSSVDPYAGTTQWVSGTPIAMGYTDTLGVHGPYKIVYGVQDKWLGNQGAAGSPMNEEHCPANSPGVPNSDDGVVQDFTNNNSRILWSGATSVHWVYGGISAKYIDVGGPWPNPAPGYPTSDEYQWGTYRRTDFDRGYIIWRSDQGTVWNYTTYTSRGTCHW